MQAHHDQETAQPCELIPPHDASRCFLYEPGRISYADGLKLQHDFHTACALGEIPGILMLLEHNPVLTMGVKTGEGNVLASREALDKLGVELVKTDRGGDVTYHGPGQLVGYPILKLRQIGVDLHCYLRTLEQTIIDTLADFDLIGTRNGPAGVWVGDKKVCSIGIAVRKWVTYHGFALNIDPNMSHFSLINPCGLASSQITSLAELLGSAPDMAHVREVYARNFANNFKLELIPWRAAKC